MRLHGRNAKQWWRHDAAEDRYNYLYSGQELREFADIAGAAKALVKKSYLYTNNHFAAKSVVNAVMLKAQLGEPIEGEYPPELIERYPDIADLVIARPPEGGLYGLYFAASFTIARLMTSGTRSFSTTSMPGNHLAEDGVPGVQLRLRRRHDVDLTVGGPRVARPRPRPQSL